MARMQLARTVDLTTWIGRTETATDTVGTDPGPALTRHPGPPGRSRSRPAHRCRRCGTGSTSCRCTGSPSSGPDGHADAVGSCPRSRCRAGCGPAAGSSSAARSGSVTRSCAPRRSTTSPARRAAPGPLVFVTVRHEVRSNGAERPGAGGVPRHRLPGRDAARTRSSRRPRPRRPGASWQREIVPDDVLLFRYSALTFNGHRIHYDRRYVTEVEGYPGLIVHGPLLATLLLDLVRRNAPDAEVGDVPVPGGAPDVRPAPVPGQRRAAAPTAACTSGPRTTRAG